MAARGSVILLKPLFALYAHLPIGTVFDDKFCFLSLSKVRTNSVSPLAAVKFMKLTQKKSLMCRIRTSSYIGH